LLSKTKTERELDQELFAKFPGAVIITQATTDYLEDLEDRAALRRGTKPLKRPKKESDLLNAWAKMLSPHFANGAAVHFTGTYSDEYGYRNGLMLARNVQRDFRRFLKDMGWGDRPFCIGVEVHESGRAILHLHALIGGSWDAAERDYLKRSWAVHRGHAKATQVVTREQCVEYAAKHCMKTDITESFDFVLSPRNGSRHERRLGRGLS